MEKSFVRSLTVEELLPLFNALRHSLKYYLREGKIVYPTLSTPHLNSACGVFITFRDANGNVRGSMGFLDTDRILILSALDCAIAAATEDPRYKKVSVDEIDTLQIEMTLIDSVNKVDPNSGDMSKLEPGSYGLYLEGKINTGVLLPKEIYDHKLDFNGALARVRVKSGVSKNERVDYYVFSARVFVQSGAEKDVYELGKNVPSTTSKIRRSILDLLMKR